MRYMPARTEPPGWQEPRKKLKFPQATPQPHRLDHHYSYADLHNLRPMLSIGMPPCKEEQETKEPHGRIASISEAPRGRCKYSVPLKKCKPEDVNNNLNQGGQHQALQRVVVPPPPPPMPPHGQGEQCQQHDDSGISSEEAKEEMCVIS